MMRKNSSVDLSLFLLIAKIGKTRGLKGEFFLRSFAQNPEALFSFKKFYALSSSKMQEVQFEFMKQNNANIVGYACIIDRSNDKSVIKAKIISQVTLNIPTYNKNNLPKELLSIEAVKPGSRNL